MMRVILILAGAGMIVASHAQSDADWRKQADADLLKEEPASALFYLRKISTRTAEDRSRELEAETLQSPGDAVTYQAVISLSKEASMQNSIACSYLVAIVEFRARNFEAALFSLRRVLKGEAPHYPLKAKMDLLAGRVFLEMNRTDSAERRLNKALHAFRADSVNAFVMIANTRTSLGRTARRKGRLDEAVAEYRAAITILEQSPLVKWDDLGRIYNNLGLAYADQGAYEAAQETYTRAIAIKNKYSPDSLNRAVTYANVASFYSGYGNYLKSQEYHAKAAGLIDSTRQSNFQLLGNHYNNYGVMLMAMREHALAVKYFQLSIQYLRKAHANSYDLLTPTINLSMCLSESGRKARALSMLHGLDSLIQATPASDPNVSLYWVAVGDINVETNPDQAWKDYSNALEALNKSSKSQPRKYSEITGSLGALSIKKREYRHAVELFRAGLVKVQKEDPADREMLTGIYNNLGLVYSDMGMDDSAAYFLNQALTSNALDPATVGLRSKAPLFANAFELIATHYRIARLNWRSYQRSANMDLLLKSAPSIDAAMEMVRLERDRMSTDKDRTMLGEDASQVFDLAALIYYELFFRTGKREYLDPLHLAVERAKQQTLLSSLKVDKIEAFAGVTGQLMNYEKDVNYSLGHLTAQLSAELGLGESASGDLLQEYDSQLLSVQRKFRTLTDSLKDHLPDYYNLKYNNIVITSDELVRDILAREPGMVMVQYHIADSSVIALITSATMRTAVRTSYREVSRMVVALRNQIHYQHPDWKATSSALYATLLTPIDSALMAWHVRVKEMLIVPDNELFFLPFEVLSENAKSSLLVERFPIGYALSSTLFWQKKTDRDLSIGDGGFIGFVPDFEGHASGGNQALRENEGLEMSFHPLEATALEVNGIADVLQKNHMATKVFEGTSASEGNFKALQTPCRYIHIATHGFVNMDEPERSGLAFSRVSEKEDDILFSHEIYNIHLNTDLICLSACETGIGKVYKGEGLMGLARGFFYAGARNLLVSLWKVEDRSTSQWMIGFYTQVAKGKRRIESVRKAKLQLLNSKDYSHPYYWAPFILMGN